MYILLKEREEAPRHEVWRAKREMRVHVRTQIGVLGGMVSGYLVSLGLLIACSDSRDRIIDLNNPYTGDTQAAPVTDNRPKAGPVCSARDTPS